MATLEGVNAAATFFKVRELPFELMQVSVAYGAPIGDGTRLAPLNPVFIVSARVSAQ
jgi:precorrin-6B methylase 2